MLATIAYQALGQTLVHAVLPLALSWHLVAVFVVAILEEHTCSRVVSPDGGSKVTYAVKVRRPGICIYNILQVAELASLAQLLPPRSPTVRNPAPDSSLCRLQSCSPIAFTSAAARRLRPLQLLLPGPIAASTSTAVPPLPPLLLPDFASAARRLHPIQLLLPIASTSAATPRLRPLQLLLPDYVRFDCCSLAGFQPMPGPKVLEHSSRSSRLLSK